METTTVFFLAVCYCLLSRDITGNRRKLPGDCLAKVPFQVQIGWCEKWTTGNFTIKNTAIGMTKPYFRQENLILIFLESVKSDDIKTE